MKKGKEIGSFYKSALENGKKSPNNNIWEKINKSLDEEKRSKRKLFYFWILGSGISAVIVLFLIFEKEIFNQTTIPEQEKSNPLIKNSSNNSEEKFNDIILIDSLIYDKNDKANFSNSEIDVKDSNDDKLDSNSKIGTKSTTKKAKSKTVTKAEIYTVKTNYYYYNSQDSTQIMTSNKKEIDSLISEKGKLKNTTNSKKLDSLEQ